MNQEYINLTRGILKTCMWVESQPFGTPQGKERKRPETTPGYTYSMARFGHINDKRLRYYVLRDVGNIHSTYTRCFHPKGPSEVQWGWNYFAHIQWKLEEVENKLYYRKIENLPQLGQGPSDFESFDAVLKEVASGSSNAANFAYAASATLREAGYNRVAGKHRVKATWEQTRSKIDVLDWSRGLQFAPLLLPRTTAEVSWERGKGITRLLLYFLRAPMSPEVDEAITCLCSLARSLAFMLENDLVVNARVSRVAHKAKMKEEYGTIFCNKACSSNRIVSRIQDGNKSMVYMYNGGGAVDANQSLLLGGVVVNCKSWRWAAWANASARLIGLASNNDLESIDPRLATSEDDGSGSTSTFVKKHWTECLHT